MLASKKVVVIMPAFNAENTLVQTYNEVMAQDIVDEVILVDDGSSDATLRLARSLTRTFVHAHAKNRGYGANQKSCYQLALARGADIIIMVHPDYQYTPKLVPAMAAIIGSGLYPCVLGSRILGGGARKGGMPLWKYVANRFLTFAANVLMRAKLSEYHTGYRAFARELLEQLPLAANSDDFVFDIQMLAQILWFGHGVAEITCPTRYFEGASSINFCRSLRYGIGCLETALVFKLTKLGLVSSKLFPDKAPNACYVLGNQENISS